MEFGVVLQTDPPVRRTVELARAAEAHGFHHVFTFDSVVLWQEPFVIYPQILAATSRVAVGPMVTNPMTRDPTVTASSLATLDEAFGPRTVLGIGRGDSAVRVTGARPASLAEVEEAIVVIRQLAGGDAATIRGHRVRLQWAKGPAPPIWMAAYGPRALALAGRVADGLILQLADPDICGWAIEMVRAAARAAGRDPHALAICVAAPAYVGEDLAHQREHLRWFGGMVGNHVAEIVRRYGADSGAVPHALTASIEGRRGYDYAHHGRSGNPSSAFVPDQVVDRFCILGPPAAHVEKLHDLAARGVTNFALYLMHDRQLETLEAYGRAVVPALQDR